MKPQGCNGWKNRETWSAALWLFNEEHLYRVALRHKKSRTPYASTVAVLIRMGDTHNGDGISWKDKRISRREMNAAIREL